MVQTKKFKLDTMSLILLGVLALSLIMAIVGVCVNWTVAEAKNPITGKVIKSFAKLADIAESNDAKKEVTGEGLAKFGGMNAFAYITMVLVILNALVYVANNLLDVKVLNLVCLVVSALTLVSAIVLLICTSSFCSEWKCKMAVGAVFVWLFGILSGLAGGYAALKARQ